MLAKYKRDDTDIEQLEKDVEELQKQRNQKNSPDFDAEVKAAEDAQKDEALSDEEKNWAKRFADTRSWSQKEINKSKKQIAELQEQIEQLKARNPESIPTSAEELEEWSKEYPEVSKAITAIATKIAEEKARELRDEVSTLKEKNTEATVELVKEEIRKVHPDFDALADNPEFHEWVETKPSWVGEALYGGAEAQPAIDAINLFKVENNLLEKGETEKNPRGRPRKDEADAAKEVARNTAESPSDSSKKGYLLESEILSWSDDEMLENIDLYAKRKAAGKIIYDVTQPQ